MTQGDRQILSLDYPDPAPPADLLDRISLTSRRLRRRRRVQAGAGAAVTACAVVVLGLFGSAVLRSDPDGTVAAGGGTAAASAEAFPGAPSIQAAVDQYVAAIRAGSGAQMARVVDKGYSAQARLDRIRKADGHPITVTKVTVRDMPSSAWKTIVLQLDDGGVRSTEEVMVGPALGEDQADPHHWKISLVPPA